MMESGVRLTSPEPRRMGTPVGPWANRAWDGTMPGLRAGRVRENAD